MVNLNEKTIQLIKLIFNIVFITILVFNITYKAFLLLPNEWLFFFTCDAFENITFALIAYFLYYFIFRVKRIRYKVLYIGIFLIIHLFLAILKDYRISSTISFDRSFEFITSFIGKTLLFYFFIYFINHLEYFNVQAKLKRELQETKAQLLRSQLHPHFLFNAFNSLYSLSLKNHPETSNYILKLSSLMRYLTDDSNSQKVLLTKEFDFIEKYIAIEKIRFGENANIQFDIEGDLYTEKMIAPLLLVTLVENAFKHGFYTNAKDAFVHIKVRFIDNTLLFHIKNSIFKKQHFEENKRKGKGLDFLKQRLYLLYPNTSNLEVKNHNNIYSATLTIHLN